MNLAFAKEPMSDDLVEEMVPLAARHFNEIASFPDIKPSIDFDFYNGAQSQGVLRIFTARNGALAGYAVFVVAKHPHHSESLQATQDLIFLAPEYRKGDAGLSFLRWCDQQLKDDGVQVVYHSSDLKRDIGPVLERIGYQHIQNVWARRLA